MRDGCSGSWALDVMNITSLSPHYCLEIAENSAFEKWPRETSVSRLVSFRLDQLLYSPRLR